MADIDELIGKEALEGADLAIDKMGKLYEVLLKDVKAAQDLTHELSNSRTITDLAKAVDELEKKVSTTTRTQKEYTQAMADAAVTRQKEIAAMKDVSRETVAITTASEKAIVAQKKLEETARAAWYEFGKGSQQFKAAAEASNKALNEIKALDATLGNARRNVGNYNNQLFSMTQVLRELPAFTYSAQTGIIGISNNLPILADEFKKVAAATNDVTGKVNGTMGALKIFGASIFSFGNIFAISIGLFTIFYKEISAFVSGTESATRSIKEMNDAFQEGSKTVSNEIVKMQQLYSTATNLEATYTARKNAVDELQKLYPSFLANIKDEEIMVGKAEAAYAKLNQELINKAIYQGFTAKANKIGEELTPLLIELDTIQDKIDSIKGQKGEKNKDGYFMTGAQSANDKMFLSELEDKATKLRNKIAPLRREMSNIFNVADNFSNELTNTNVTGKKDGKTPIDKLKDLAEEARKAKEEFDAAMAKARALIENTYFDPKPVSDLEERLKRLTELFSKMDNIAMGVQSPDELSNTDADKLDRELKARKSPQQIAQEEKELLEKKLQQLSEYVQSAQQLLGSIGQLTDSLYAREFAALDAKEARLNELHAQEMQFIEQSGMSQAKKEKAKQRLEAETAAKQKQIDKEKKRATVEQAKLDKIYMSMQIIGQTAIAVMGFLAKQQYTQAIIAGSTGAIQLAALAAAPLPEYKDGRKGGKEELAIVSEVGQEGLRDKHGNLSLLPKEKSIVLLPEGADVIPAHEMIKNKAYTRLAKEGGTVTPQRMQEIMMDEAVMELKGLRQDLRNRKFYNDTTGLIGYDNYIKGQIK